MSLVEGPGSFEEVKGKWKHGNEDKVREWFRLDIKM